MKHKNYSIPQRTIMFSRAFSAAVFMILAVGGRHSHQQNVTKTPPLELGSPCHFAEPNCGLNAVCTRTADSCDMGLCHCQPGRYAPAAAVNRRHGVTDCVRVLRAGARCNPRQLNEATLPEFSYCSPRQLVTCQQYFDNIDGDCIPSMRHIAKYPGEPCGIDRICNPYSGMVCARYLPLTLAKQASNETSAWHQQGTCLCPNSLIFVDGFCRPALVGDPCFNDGECRSLSPGGRCSMLSRRCICGEGYVAVSAMVGLPPQSSKLILAHFCMPDRPRSPYVGWGDVCTVPFRYDPNDASSPLVYCDPELTCVRCPEMASLPQTQGACHVTYAKVLHEDLVWPNRLVQGPFLEATTLFSQSIGSSCDPFSNFEDQQCGFNATCKLVDGPCAKGQCSCLDDSYVPSRNRPSACEPRLKIGELCHFDLDLHRMPEHSVCLNFEVQCPGQLLANNDRTACHLPTRNGDFGDYCDEEYFTCNYLNGLICGSAANFKAELVYGSRYCRCPDDLVFKDGKCQKAMYGDECWNDMQCSMVYRVAKVADSPSICRSEKCLCRAGYTPAGFSNDYYCVPSWQMVKQRGEPCLASAPVDRFNLTTMTYCRLGLNCWLCPEFNQAPNFGECLENKSQEPRQRSSMPPTADISFLLNDALPSTEQSDQLIAGMTKLNFITGLAASLLSSCLLINFCLLIVFFLKASGATSIL